MMIESAEQTITTCQRCGAPIEQKPGRGHRPRLYCDDRGKCRQRAHRARKEVQRVERETFEMLHERIATLEKEVEELHERLDLEGQFQRDTRKRDFKIWLRSHLQPTDSTFFKRFLDDRDLPASASRSLYEARLRQHGYSIEDIELFRDAWKRMLAGFSLVE